MWRIKLIQSYHFRDQIGFLFISLLITYKEIINITGCFEVSVVVKMIMMSDGLLCWFQLSIELQVQIFLEHAGMFQKSGPEFAAQLGKQGSHREFL